MSGSYFSVASGRSRNRLFQGELGEYGNVKLTVSHGSTPIMPEALQRMLFVTASAVMLTVTWAAPVSQRYLFLPTILLLMLFWIVERIIQRNNVEAFAQALLGEEPEEMSREEAHQRIMQAGKTFTSTAAAQVFGKALFEEVNNKSKLLSLFGSISGK